MRVGKIRVGKIRVGKMRVGKERSMYMVCTSFVLPGFHTEGGGGGGGRPGIPPPPRNLEIEYGY